MDSQLRFDINFNSYVCPKCHNSTFSEHIMQEYQREWNKCTFCGYMELKTITVARIINVLKPEQLSEPFVDPLLEIIDKTLDMNSDAESIDSNKKEDS